MICLAPSGQSAEGRPTRYDGDSNDRRSLTGDEPDPGWLVGDVGRRRVRVLLATVSATTTHFLNCDFDDLKLLPRRRLKGHSSQGWDVAVSRDGESLVTFRTPSWSP